MLQSGWYQFALTPSHPHCHPQEKANNAIVLHVRERYTREKRCIPTIISFLHSNVFSQKDNREREEGEVNNKETSVWGEPDAENKEMMLSTTRVVPLLRA